MYYELGNVALLTARGLSCAFPAAVPHFATDAGLYVLHVHVDGDWWRITRIIRSAKIRYLIEQL